jgi:hypothetical protein
MNLAEGGIRSSTLRYRIQAAGQLDERTCPAGLRPARIENAPYDIHAAFDPSGAGNTITELLGSNAASIA